MITTTPTGPLCGCDIALCILNMGMTVSKTHAKSFKYQTIRSIQSLEYINSIKSLSTDKTIHLLKQADNKHCSPKGLNHQHQKDIITYRGPRTELIL